MRQSAHWEEEYIVFISASIQSLSFYGLCEQVFAVIGGPGCGGNRLHGEDLKGKLSGLVTCFARRDGPVPAQIYLVLSRRMFCFPA